MAGFTPEQRELLAAALDHVWARMSELNDHINDESERVAALGLILAEQGLITAEQWEGAIAQLALQAGMQAKQAGPQETITEEEITREILAGDVDAFHRRQEQEDDDE
jgi:hypothetical protein